ncbi:MAG: transporter substrate-binding domain-containing protein [Cyclobacteriaceae bacterium]
MNKKILFISVLIVLTSQLCAQKIGDSWAKVKSEGGSLSVVYYEQAGLIEEVNGKPEGLCVEILEDFVAFVQKKYSKKITLQYVGKEPVFTNFLATTQKGVNILGVTNVTITDERKKILKFTPPFISNPVVLLTHKDAPAVTSMAELSKKLDGYSAEIIGGSTHVKYINKVKKENWPALSIAFGPSGQEILKKITSTSKLFTILDFTEFVDANRRRLPVKKQNVDFGDPEQLAFVMSKQSDWDEVWKEFLTDEYRKSPQYRKNVSDHLGMAFLSILK